LGSEFITIFGLLLLVLAMIVQGKTTAKILPIVGLFGTAAFRLMPSATRILTSLQNFRYASPAIEVVEKEMEVEIRNKSKTNFEKITRFNKVQVQDFYYRYEGKTEYALRNVNLEFKIGESIGIMGSSGAGKSTLVDLLLCLLTPKKGKILVD
jgi:ATP-binding cassette, subfamily B, bacterial PglK